jgi:hypothetical protein
MCPKVLMLSSEISECKPLVRGGRQHVPPDGRHTVIHRSRPRSHGGGAKAPYCWSHRALRVDARLDKISVAGAVRGGGARSSSPSGGGSG